MMRTRAPGRIGVLSAAWMPTSVAFTSVFQIDEKLSQPSWSIVTRGRRAPALRISTSGSISATVLLISAASVASPTMVRAPASRAAPSFVGSRAIAVTAAPRSANAPTIARPSPALPPVTMTREFARSVMGLSCSGVTRVGHGAHDRIQRGERRDPGKIGLHARVALHCANRGGVTPLRDDDDARAVLGCDEAGRAPPVQSHDHRVGVLAQQVDEHRLVRRITGQHVDEGRRGWIEGNSVHFDFSLRVPE